MINPYITIHNNNLINSRIYNKTLLKNTNNINNFIKNLSKYNFSVLYRGIFKLQLLYKFKKYSGFYNKKWDIISIINNSKCDKLILKKNFDLLKLNVDVNFARFSYKDELYKKYFFALKKNYKFKNIKRKITSNDDEYKHLLFRHFSTMKIHHFHYKYEHYIYNIKKRSTHISMLITCIRARIQDLNINLTINSYTNTPDKFYNRCNTFMNNIYVLYNDFFIEYNNNNFSQCINHYLDFYNYMIKALQLIQNFINKQNFKGDRLKTVQDCNTWFHCTYRTLEWWRTSWEEFGIFYNNSIQYWKYKNSCRHILYYNNFTSTNNKSIRKYELKYLIDCFDTLTPKIYHRIWDATIQFCVIHIPEYIHKYRLVPFDQKDQFLNNLIGDNEECKKIIEKEHQNSKLRCITDELSNSKIVNNKIELSPLQHQRLISALKNYNN